MIMRKKLSTTNRKLEHVTNDNQVQVHKYSLSVGRVRKQKVFEKDKNNLMAQLFDLQCIMY